MPTGCPGTTCTMSAEAIASSNRWKAPEDVVVRRIKLDVRASGTYRRPFRAGARGDEFAEATSNPTRIVSQRRGSDRKLFRLRRPSMASNLTMDGYDEMMAIRYQGPGVSKLVRSSGREIPPAWMMSMRQTNTRAARAGNARALPRGQPGVFRHAVHAHVGRSPLWISTITRIAVWWQW